MAEQKTPSGGQPTTATSTAAPDEGDGKGETTIADGVVTKVAGIAAREVGGVYDLGGGLARAVGGVAQRVGAADQRMQGVSVEVGQREAAVDLTLVIEYGESIPEVADAVRKNIIQRVEGTSGLSVTEVNIAVADLHFPGDDTESSQDSAHAG